MDLGVRKLTVERFPVFGATAQELRPGWDGDVGIYPLGQQRPQLRVMPAEIGGRRCGLVTVTLFKAVLSALSLPYLFAQRLPVGRPTSDEERMEALAMTRSPPSKGRH